MLNKISQLSEATKETGKGRIHTAEPGGYGRKDDEDEEGNKVKADAPKRGRGRPKKDADASGEVKKYDWSGFGVKQGKDVKLPKHSGKVTKHKLKEYIEEAEQIQIKPASQLPKTPGQSSIPSQQQVAGQPKKDTQVIQQGNKTLGTVDNPQLAQQIKQSIGKGEMTLMPGEEMAEDSYSAKAARAGKDIGKPGKQFAKIAKSAGERYGSKERGEKVAGAVLAKLRAKTNEADMPPNDSLSSPLTLEAKAKPDYIDLDKDGNKKESMKKAASDKKNKVTEGSHRHSAARLLGKAHALAKEAYNCRYDDMEEAKMYHEGFKEGLDECYGQGVYEMAMPATVGGMADQAMEDDMMEVSRGEYMKQQAKSTPGDTFKAFGQTFKDTEVLESPFAFESWDKQLNALLEGKEVNEGMTVSISKGQQGAPDSVTVSAQDGEADQLLAAIKQAGLGLFGDEGQNSAYGAPMTVDTDGGQAHGGVDVVGDHDGMMALIKKVTGADQGGQDYEDEEGHDHEETCDACGSADCQCDDEEMVETETLDQSEEQVAEDNPPDSGAAEEEEEIQDTAQANAAAAEEDEAEAEEVTEWANDAAQDTREERTLMDPDFMMNTITGGLNKKKIDVAGNGQTTVPVTAVRESSITEWMKLAGIK